MKKKLLKIYIILITLISFSSCTVFEDREFSSAEGVKNIEIILLENYSEKDIYTLTIGSKDELSNSFGNAKVCYFEANESYSQIWDYMNKLRNPISSITEFKEEEFGLTKISDLKISDMSNQFNKAISIIKEKYKGYDDFSLYQYSITVKPDGILDRHFVINATGDATSTGLQGKNIVMEYQKFLFNVNENGDIELIEK